MVTVFSFSMVNLRRRDHPNQAAVLWALGTSVLAFLGAGVWGFLHTLAPVNYYTHGPQITAPHGHLAFYAAHVMILLTHTSYAMPRLPGLGDAQPAQALRVQLWGLGLMTLALLAITPRLTPAGVATVGRHDGTTTRRP